MEKIENKVKLFDEGIEIKIIIGTTCENINECDVAYARIMGIDPLQKSKECYAHCMGDKIKDNKYH